MSIGDADLRLLMGLQTVERWQIVEMTRRQSVAEHSFRVWALVTHLWDSMFPLNHNSFDRELAQRWALFHDAAEGRTGDIPTPAKKTLELLAPGVCKRLDEAVLQEHAPHILETWRGVQGSIAEVVVEIADTVEALMHLAMHQHDPRFMDIYDKLSTSLEARIAQAVVTFPGKPWDVARQWCRKRLGYSTGLAEEPAPQG